MTSRRWLQNGRWAWLGVPLAILALTPPATAQRALFGAPRLHEPIPADPREDVALGLSLDGDLPAGINTPSGLVTAPDPARPFGSGDAPYSAAPKGDSPGSTFRPDRNTSKPDQLPYDDPFSPSTAPFKRLSAWDSVDENYTLSVRDGHATPLAIMSTPSPDPSEEQFYADMVVDLAAGTKVRIPSVGPGARVLHAHAGVGTQDVKFTLYKDGAENWFIEGDATTRARLVMQVSIPRTAFGGDFGSPTRAELRGVPPLPENVRRAAAQVSQRIGVTPRSAPREVVTKLVAYFRAFQDSDESSSDRGDIYLDLALRQKGVCRHRSFAFLVTALYLGIPTRMISNEAHAWVEVDDGHAWRRVDLGGAGRMLHDPLSTNASHEPPPDPFSWPQGANRGEDLAYRARRANDTSNAPPGSPSASPSGAPSGSPNGSPSGAPGTPNPRSSADGRSSGLDPWGGRSGGNGGGSGSGFGPSSGGAGAGDPNGTGGTGLRQVVPSGPDERPSSAMSLTLATGEAHRGAPLPVRGQVTAEGEPCGHVAVEIVLRGRTAGDIPVGVLATDERGNFDGSLVLPTNLPLGEYDARARTLGDARCGVGQTK